MVDPQVAERMLRNHFALGSPKVLDCMFTEYVSRGVELKVC